MEEENTPLVRSVGVIDENLNFVPYGSTAIEKGVPVFVFNTKEEYDQHAPTLPEPCVVITLDDIDTGGFEFDSAIDPESENAVQNKVIAAALETLRDKATFERLGMVRFTDATTVTDQNSGYALSAIEKNASVEGTIANEIEKKVPKNGVSEINGRISVFSEVQPNDTSVYSAQIVSVAKSEYPEGSVSGYGFYNEGAVGGFLYLQDDGKLYFVNTGGSRFRISLEPI